MQPAQHADFSCDLLQAAVVLLLQLVALQLLDGTLLMQQAGR
jgi:hypothetical protein